MKKRIISLLILGMMIFELCTIVYAFPIVSIDVKETFTSGETVFFNYSISSSIMQEVYFKTSLKCDNAPIPEFESKTVRVSEENVFHGSMQGFRVDPQIESQQCSAEIEEIFPEHKLIQRNFSIITDISMSPIEFDVRICGDERCRKMSKVYTKNERIYFSYLSDDENIEVDATLVYPDKSRSKIFIPKFNKYSSMKFEKVGNYQLEVVAKKDGVREVVRTENFGIMEGNAEISSYIVHESPFSNLGGGLSDSEGSRIYIYLIVIILLSGAAIVGIILYVVIKK